tara:strand:+ start:3424 stop:3579 length:156 start_codon:yes stop_codon:yes gene_type:complete
MSQSTVYISSTAKQQLREIARKHFTKESQILEKYISDTHAKMKNSYGRKVL